MSLKKARIISLVPSWTETLLTANLNVVGRTRFCVHPEAAVRDVAVVGGTKGVDLNKIVELKPDVVILDREENKKELAVQLTQHQIKFLDSHVCDLQTAGSFLIEMADFFDSETLRDYGQRYLDIRLRRDINQEKFWAEALRAGEVKASDLGSLAYVIWKNPYMVIGQNTFIADVLSLVGITCEAVEKYPEVTEEQLKKKFCLLSSEPFPFEKDFKKMIQQGFRAALIDGEKISWYGVRNLTFLERCRQ